MIKISHTKKLPTAGRIGRIVKITVTRVKRSTAEKIFRGANKFSELNNAAKADYIKNMVQRMKQKLGDDKTKEIFRECGMMCCGATSRNLAKKLADQSRSLKELVEKLNKRHLGGGRLKIKDENTITGSYDRCYCGIVSKTSKKFPDLTYCQCSTGWYKQLFETALRRSVEVKILKSIINGSKTCEFIISLK